MAQCPAVRGGPPRPLASGKMTDKRNGGTTLVVDGRGRKAVVHTGTTPCACLKRNCKGAARDGLNYPCCVLCSGGNGLHVRALGCTSHVLSLCVCVKKTGRVLCTHLNIQFYKNNLPAGVHNLILFLSLRRAETSNIIPAFDHVAH